MRRCCSQCCCAHCNRRYTARTILGISAWRIPPIPTLQALSGVIRICSCIARFAQSYRDVHTGRANRRHCGICPLLRRARKHRSGKAWDCIARRMNGADEATRDVEAWLKCQFMLDKRGEIYEGAVSGVTAFGLFVTLEPLFVEGLVHISTLGPEYLEYDAIKNELRARTGARYGLSDRVRVQVSRVDPDARKIDLLLVERSA